MNEISTDEFDYSLLSSGLAEKIKEKDYILIGLHSKYSKEVGKVLHEAQRDFSDYNNGGLFEKWYTSRGFKKRNVYNYIQIYNEVQSLHGDKLEVFQELPKSLQIEASKKSIDTELKEKVLSGDITTHKQFKEMEQAKNEAEQRAKQAESKAQTERKERERLEQENEELASAEPEKIEVVPDDVKHRLESTQRQLNFVNSKLKEYEKEKELNKLNEVEFDEEQAEKERKKLEWEADKSVLEMKIEVDNFLERVSINAFRKGAIASSGKTTKEKLENSVSELKEFVNQMEIVLSGRIEI